MLRLSEITIYPIKSAGRIALELAEVEARGLAQDRRWMLIDENQRFLTQRQHPRMALIDVRLDGAALVLNAPGMDTLVLPFAYARVETAEVTIWRDRCAAWVCPEDVNAWFSHFMGLSCRLVHMAEDQIRPVDPDYAQAGDTVGFADGYPLLLISEASLVDLNTRLESPVSMRQFRPNLVVAGGRAFQEDGWRRIRIGECEFELVKPCARCVLTTVDPDRGVAHPGREPLRTLMRYRTRENGVMFGQNLIARRLGRLRLGDAVEILD